MDDDYSQLSTAMLAVVFAAVMLVAGQLHIEYRASKRTEAPIILRTAVVSL
jgi:hypothetical protein